MEVKGLLARVSSFYMWSWSSDSSCQTWSKAPSPAKLSLTPVCPFFMSYSVNYLCRKVLQSPTGREVERQGSGGGGSAKSVRVFRQVSG